MRRTLVALCWSVGLLAALPAQAQVLVHTVSVTTDGSGAATAYTPSTFGTVLAIRYVPDGSTPFDATADVTITDNESGLGILVVTNLGASARDFHPRVYTMDTTGITAVYAAAGQPVLDRIPIAGSVKLVIAQGGATKSGTFYVYIQGR